MAGDPYGAGVNRREVIVDGYAREYYVYVPAVLNRTRDGVAVVLAYHGSGASGARFLSNSGWTEEADKKGFVAVFLSALPYFELKSGGWETLFNTWSDDVDAATEVDLDFRPPGYPTDQHWPADDLAFTDAVIDDVVSVLDADPDRIYASGFSNGGVFAMRLAVDRTDRIAAVASFGGDLRTAGEAPDPIPVLYSFGNILEGDMLPLDAEQLLAIPGIAQKIETMTSAFGLRSDVYKTREQRWSTTIDFTEPAACAPASIFEMLVLDGVKHEFPKPASNPHKFSAAKESWQFFHRHGR